VVTLHTIHHARRCARVQAEYERAENAERVDEEQ
jgi:hypothetical protein